MHKNTGLLTLLSFTILIAACTGAKTATRTASTSSVFPVWYQPSFTSDSLGYRSGATAMASDSLTAIQRAEIAARAELESHIAAKMEEVRKSLETGSSSYASKADFIILLRNAHARVESSAEVADRTSVRVPNGYRGFAVASITKETLQTLMRRGFSSNQEYWRALSSSSQFKALF